MKGAPAKVYSKEDLNTNALELGHKGGTRAGLSAPIRGVQSTTSVNGLPKTALAARRMARCVNMERFAHLCIVMSRMHQRNKGYPFDSLVDFARTFYR
ncbi:hypothetical protein Tco_1128572, partial [Tanacetum coccineum]